ncbi:MAG: TIGR00269 family protein [Thermoplasmatota archaeon]
MGRPVPSCSKCAELAVTFLRYSGAHLCKAHFLRFFEKRAKQAVHDQGRLPKGTIAVALSGGKDSVSALHFLHKLTANRPDVDLVAVSVDEGIDGYRDSALDICKELTDQLNVPWHVVSVKELGGYTIDEYSEKADGRAPCGPCGVFRRMGMNQVARDLGCAAIATGHNLDDTAQTILMNVLKGDTDRLARLAPHNVNQRVEGLVPRMIPFRTIPEKEVLLYAILNDLPLHHEAECPYAARAQRFMLRDMLLELEGRTPGTRHSLLRFHDRVKPLLMEDLGVIPVQACPKCGEPTSSERCKACDWKVL